MSDDQEHELAEETDSRSAQEWALWVAKASVTIVLMGGLTFIAASFSPKAYVKDMVQAHRDEVKEDLKPYDERLRKVERAQTRIQVQTCYTAQGVARLLKERAPECIKVEDNE